MCGRYGFGNPARLGTLPLGAALPALEAHFNMAPSSKVPIVRQLDGKHTGERDATLAHWGLVPFWADDPSIGNKLANARGDTVATKPSFRAAFKQRRGLMPADLYYEWQVIEGQKVKQPWCIRMPDDAPFCFGAIWERWTPKADPGAESLVSCAIITTDANEATSHIHHRMPVIIAPEDFEQWLDPKTSPADAQTLVRPYEGAVNAFRVSTRVNSPRANDAECIAPLD